MERRSPLLVTSRNVKDGYVLWWKCTSTCGDLYLACTCEM